MGSGAFTPCDAFDVDCILETPFDTKKGGGGHASFSCRSITRLLTCHSYFFPSYDKRTLNKTWSQSDRDLAAGCGFNSGPRLVWCFFSDEGATEYSDDLARQPVLQHINMDDIWRSGTLSSPCRCLKGCSSRLLLIEVWILPSPWLVTKQIQSFFFVLCKALFC